MQNSEQVAREWLQEREQSPLTGAGFAKDVSALTALLERTRDEAQRELIKGFMVTQSKAWKSLKFLRDATSQLALNAEMSLDELESLGMAEHLPTISEMCGLLGKAPEELAAMDEAAYQRIRAAAIRAARKEEEK